MSPFRSSGELAETCIYQNYLGLNKTSFCSRNDPGDATALVVLLQSICYASTLVFTDGRNGSYLGKRFLFNRIMTKSG
jgi:hypothetical protein